VAPPTSIAVVAKTRAFPLKIMASGLPGMTSPHAAAAAPAVMHSKYGACLVFFSLSEARFLKNTTGASTARATKAPNADQLDGPYPEQMSEARTTPITAVYAASASEGTAATRTSVEVPPTEAPGWLTSRSTASWARLLALTFLIPSDRRRVSRARPRRP